MPKNMTPKFTWLVGTLSSVRLGYFAGTKSLVVFFYIGAFTKT